MSALPARPRQTNCEQEPAYPGMPTVVWSFRFPDHDLTVHLATDRCALEYPHPIAECAEWQDAAP